MRVPCSLALLLRVSMPWAEPYGHDRDALANDKFMKRAVTSNQYPL